MQRGKIMPYAYIKAVSAVIPEAAVRPDTYLEQIHAAQYGIEEYFISRVCGIHEVRRFDDGISSCDAAVKACLKLFDALHDQAAEHIDCVIFCGMRPDYNEPSAAHEIAKSLGLVPDDCFNIGNACLSFVTALKLVDSAIKTGLYRNVLICSAERHEDIARDTVTRINREKPDSIKDRIGAFTMGDCAVAMLVSTREHVEQFHLFETRSLPRHFDLCHYHEAAGEYSFHMEMSKISIRTLALLEKMLPETLAEVGMDQTDIDCLITHQIGSQPFDRTIAIAGVERSQAIETYPWMGNVASCTIPLCMTLMLHSGKLKPKDKVLAFSTGSGISATEVVFTMSDCAFGLDASQIGITTSPAAI